ncbi:Sac2 family-domain-containing protein [Yarrowia lipolytica]|uniref:Sac2 family-domain-containing protein n=1 Tax=Yarrowia lipolytica TaxID=4952 RepID=A0A371CE53_YARLL|nr:Sac2 family-domain-containing protein [Yarrowia lipolytica]RDW34916.1 Sac2 family-domain-containing protein [Yarrowia lipolytica]RDW48618.1 Sac2 family-domain-containing protein [Yarrowia lipolytica]RDW55243.1 Sac2 family-domain-containing protein [Yarrowia lipolytica]
MHVNAHQSQYQHRQHTAPPQRHIVMSSSSLGIDKLGFGMGRSSSDMSREDLSGMSGFSSGIITPSQSVSGYTTPQGRRNGRAQPPSARAERYVDALAEVKAILNPHNLALTEEEVDYAVDLDWDAIGDVSLEAVAQDEQEDFVVSEKPDSEAIGRKKRGLEQLRAQLEESDVALKQLEDYLAWFQKDLGSLSADMELLQGKSLAISERLNKRMDVEKILAPKIDSMIVPGHISQTIFEGDLDTDWIKCVHEFDALQTEEERKIKVEEKKKEGEKADKEEVKNEEKAGNKEENAEDKDKDAEDTANDKTDNSAPVALQESAFDKNDAPAKPQIKIEISGPAGHAAVVASPVVKLDPISKASQFQSRLLKDKIIERSRDYFVLKIKQIRLPGVNVQQIQREMRQNKDMYIYLERHYPELAVGLKKAYVNTIKWYYLSNFTRYISCLEKLNIKTVDKSILLGTDDGRGASSGGILGGIYGSSAATPRDPSIATSQELMNTTAKRIRQLEEEESTVMPAKIAENNPLHHWLETGFRSLMQALLDNCNVEYEFLNDLFGTRHAVAHSPQASPAKQTVSRIDKLFQKIFLPTFEAISNYTNELTSTTYDAFGMLICIRICQKMAGQSHGVPMLRAVYKRLAMLLWPRLQIILDANCESLRRAASKPSSFVSANNSANPNMAAFAPIQVTQEWANFEAAILTLSKRPKAVREPVAQCLGRLQNEFESFLTKVSGCLGSSKTKGIQERRETFLYNNYFLVSTIIGDIEGDLAQEQKTHLQQLLDAYKQT